MGKRATRRPSKDLLQARQLLREMQAPHLIPAGADRPVRPQSTLAATLAQLEKYLAFEPSPRPGCIRRGGFTYDRKLEQRRIALARGLLRRTDPGPFEDPVYLAMLAYQAASLDMAFPKRIGIKKTDPGFSRFLLGTIHSAVLNAWCQRFRSHRYTVVALHSALIEFAYQAAKAVVAAPKPAPTADGRRVTVNTDKEHLAAQLAADPEPIDRLYRTLEAYFFNGYPRAYANETVPAEQQLPLALLIGMTERWIIGHEFGHGFAAGIRWEGAPNASQAEEFFADDQATIHTVQSAETLDGVEPTFALAGGAFALASLELFRRAHHTVLIGTVLPDDGKGTHPSNQARTDHLFDTFERYFEVGTDETQPRLAFVIRAEDWKPTATDAGRQRRERACYWPDVLFTLWDHVEPRLLRDFENKRPLHPMWRPEATPESA
jgi:hypothetical protein